MQQTHPTESAPHSKPGDSCAPEGIHKIAALIATVDACAAQEILAHLPPKVARQVHLAVKDLTTVSPQEQAELYAELSIDSTQDTHTAAAPSAENTCDHEDELGVWQAIGASNLARLLRDERPQIIAVVLTQLNDQFAAEVLSLFGGVQSREVVRAAAELGTIPPATLRAIRKTVADQIEQMQEEERRKQASLECIQSIIELAPETLRNEWNAAVHEPTEIQPVTSASLGNEALGYSLPDRNSPAEDNPAVALLRSDKDVAVPFSENGVARSIPLTDAATRPQTPRVSIADFPALIRLPRDAMALVMEQLHEETILIALAGAPPQWATEFESLLSRDEFRLIEEGIQSLGAISLADIDRAQDEFVQAANQLLATKPTLRATA